MTGFRQVSNLVFTLYIVSVVASLGLAFWLGNGRFIDDAFVYIVFISCIYFVYTITEPSELQKLEKYLKYNKKAVSSSGPIEAINFTTIYDKSFTLVDNKVTTVFTPSGMANEFGDLKYIKITTDSPKYPNNYYLALEDGKTYLIELIR